MRIIQNAGADRAIDTLAPLLKRGAAISMASNFSLFAYSELRTALEGVGDCRIVLPDPAK